MNRKFRFLVLNGLKKKFTSKPFIITNIIMLVLFVGMSNINNIINYFGGNKSDHQVLKIHLVDSSNKYKDVLKKYINIDYNKDENNKDNQKKDNFEIISAEKNLEDLKKDIKDKEDIILEISEKEGNLLVNVISNDSVDQTSYQEIVTAINLSKYEITAKESNISEEDLKKLNTPASVSKTILNLEENTKKEENKKIIDIIFPIFILPFYILIIQLINYIGSEINEEKSSKSMEVIISSISAKTHFYSKIISNNIFVVSQMLLFLLYGAIGLMINNIVTKKALLSFEIFNGLSTVNFGSEIYFFLPLLIILIIGTFFTYSLITGILVSMTVNNEDLQHVQTPLILISLIGYYLAIGSGFLQGNILIKVLSFIPLLSCFLAPSLFITGQVSIVGFVFSITIVYLFNYILAKFGIKIYKIGILNYSTDKMWTKLFKAVKD